MLLLLCDKKALLACGAYTCIVACYACFSNVSEPWRINLSSALLEVGLAALWLAYRSVDDKRWRSVYMRLLGVSPFQSAAISCCFFAPIGVADSALLMLLFLRAKMSVLPLLLALCMSLLFVFLSSLCGQRAIMRVRLPVRMGVRNPSLSAMLVLRNIRSSHFLSAFLFSCVLTGLGMRLLFAGIPILIVSYGVLLWSGACCAVETVAFEARLQAMRVVQLYAIPEQKLVRAKVIPSATTVVLEAVVLGVFGYCSGTCSAVEATACILLAGVIAVSLRMLTMVAYQSVAAESKFMGLPVLCVLYLLLGPGFMLYDFLRNIKGIMYARVH